MLRKIKQLSAISDQRSAKKSLFLAVFSGILLVLSFPGFNLEFLAWFSFVALFSALKNKAKIPAFLLGYLCGLVFWSVTIYWLVHVTLLGTILLILYLALYFGIFALVFATSEELRAKSLLFIPAVWVLLEYLRSYLLTGFPWALLAYSQYLNLPMIQIAEITGAWGVSFLVMLVNVALFSVASDKLTGRRLAKALFLPLCCLILVLLYGEFRLHPGKVSGASKNLKVVVVQGNISREMEWQTDATDFILQKYLRLSRLAAKDSPDLIVWPEAAVPGVLTSDSQDDFKTVSRLAKEMRTALLTGVVTLRDNAYYNSAILVDAEGSLSASYDKLHLVPFGEYIPLKKILPFLESMVPIGDISAGKDRTLFRLDLPSGPGHGLGAKFSALICFEDLFPELARRFVKEGAIFLVNITNDSWYKKSAASYQHSQAAVFRAVENRVFIVRSANTGISGFISPQGKIISLVEDKGEKIFIAGYKSERLNIERRAKTLYTLWGDWFVVLSFIFFWFFSGIGSRFCPLCRLLRLCRKEG